MNKLMELACRLTPRQRILVGAAAISLPRVCYTTTLVLVCRHHPFFHTAERMAGAINLSLKTPRAHVSDSRRVEIATDPGEDLPALLDQIEGIEIDVYPKARVVVNERTGTVVIGG